MSNTVKSAPKLHLQCVQRLYFWNYYIIQVPTSMSLWLARDNISALPACHNSQQAVSVKPSLDIMAPSHCIWVFPITQIHVNWFWHPGLHKVADSADYTGRHWIGTLFQWKFKSEEFNSICSCKHDLSWKVCQSSTDSHHYLILLLHISNNRIKWKSEIRQKRGRQQLERYHFLTSVWRHNHRNVTGRSASKALA